MTLSRNGFNTQYLMTAEVNLVDHLYDICDAEFSSRKDFYSSFYRATGELHWARYFVLEHVRQVAVRENMSVSTYLALSVARAISVNWFRQRAADEHAIEQKYHIAE